MRMRERGIGNLPFIAVLVLLVIAIALFFVKSDESDKTAAELKTAKQTLAEQRDQLVKAGNAYRAWLDVSGLKDAALQITEKRYPTPDQIKDTVRGWMMKEVDQVRQKSVATLQNREYQVKAGGTDIGVQKGEKTTITLFSTPFVKETITFQSLIAPLGGQFAYAADAIQTNNTQFETENAAYKQKLKQLETRIGEIEGQYQGDVQGKAQQYDTEKQRADDFSDQVNKLNAEVDNKASTISQLQTQFTKEKRSLVRDAAAWKNRAVNEIERKKLALAEDPKDGEVLYANQREGLVFIDRGRKYHVSRGMKFTVWRTGKGGVREDIAVVRVIKTDQTRSTCRVLQWKNRRVPVSKGMNISNPFYDPFKPLRVYIYGNLKYYPTDLAKRRLAEGGAIVQRDLDERVDVIVLGEPPVTVDEDLEDEEEAAVAKRRAGVERTKRLREIRDLAVSIGAIVVTEDVLRTFISY